MSMANKPNMRCAEILITWVIVDDIDSGADYSWSHMMYIPMCQEMWNSNTSLKRVNIITKFPGIITLDMVPCIQLARRTDMLQSDAATVNVQIFNVFDHGANGTIDSTA